MRIGIDAHTLGSRSSGNESYCLQLLRGLVQAAGDEDQYMVYFTRLNGVADIAAHERVTFLRIWPVNPVIRIPISFPFEFRKRKLDVFHAQYILPPLCPCRSVVSIHDIIFEQFPQFFSRFEVLRSKTLFPWSARRADHIITLSQFSKNEIVSRYHVPPEKVSVIYEAPRREFRPMNRGQCQEKLVQKYRIRSPFILYVGRVQARKNLLRLVDAFARLSSRGIDEQLVVVGGHDWLAERVKHRVAELNLTDKVRFTGYVDLSDLPLFYNAAELFVFPSISEGFGIPVLEALACGVPVVTSYGSSLEEISGGAAVLADPFSIDSIAGAISTVLSNTELKSLLRQKGLLRAADFTERRKTVETLAVYRRVHAYN